jgi:hypothetical protein
MVSATGTLALMGLCLVLGGVLVHLHYQRLGRVYLEGQRQTGRLRQQVEELEKEMIRQQSRGLEQLAEGTQTEPLQLGPRDWDLLQTSGGVKVIRRRNT